jgi:hypothetical protein
VSLEAYFERSLADVARRIAVLERHDEIARERQGEYLTRERFDERCEAMATNVDALGRATSNSEHLASERGQRIRAELERTIEGVDRRKPDSEIVERLAARVLALETAAGEQHAIDHRRDMSRQNMLLTVGVVGAFSSAVMSVILHALGVG